MNSCYQYHIYITSTYRNKTNGMNSCYQYHILKIKSLAKLENIF